MLHPSMLAVGPITTLAGVSAGSYCELVGRRLRERDRAMPGRSGQDAACLFSGVYRIPFAYSGRRLRDAGHCFWHQPDFACTGWALHHGIGLGATLIFLDVGFRKGTPLARFGVIPIGRFMTGFFGWAFTMSWAALGLNYTLFDNYLLSFAVLRGAIRF
jgi:hypothetical protein